ncbi:MAG: hypothetical protein LH603_04755 [Pseudonocardia sp.]|nr:hypothetical protein [Pseudonocardia sp.]
MAVNPTGADMKTFLAVDPDQPIVMLDLPRFAPGGSRRYDAYLAHFRPYAAKVGASVLYYGHGTDPVVAEHGQDWDAVLAGVVPDAARVRRHGARPRLPGGHPPANGGALRGGAATDRGAVSRPALLV